MGRIIYFKQARERGVKMISLVGSTRQALRQVERGADMIVAQGYDAAGHTGGVGTFLHCARDRLRDCRMCRSSPPEASPMAAIWRPLYVSGAAGVWTGTVWLTSKESDVDPLIKATNPFGRWGRDNAFAQHFGQDHARVAVSLDRGLGA